MALNIELISGGTPTNGVLPSTWQYYNVGGNKNGFNINPGGKMIQSANSNIMDYSNNLKLSFDLYTSYYNIQNSAKLDLNITFSSGRVFKLSIPIQYTESLTQNIEFPIKIENEELVSSWNISISNSDKTNGILINNISLFLGDKKEEGTEDDNDYEDSSGSYVDEYSKWDTICGTKDIMRTVTYGDGYSCPTKDYTYTWMHRNFSQGRILVNECHKQSPKRVPEGVFGIRKMLDKYHSPIDGDYTLQFCKMNDSFNITHTFTFKSPQYDLDYERSSQTTQDISWVVVNKYIYIASWVVGHPKSSTGNDIVKGTLKVRKLDLNCKLISEFTKVFTSKSLVELYVPYGDTHVSIMANDSKIRCIVKGLTDNYQVTRGFDYTELLFTQQGTLLSRTCRIDKSALYGATRCGNKWYVLDMNYDSFHQVLDSSIGIGIYDSNLNRIDYKHLSKDVTGVMKLDCSFGSEITYWDSYSENGKLKDRGVCLILNYLNSSNKILVYSEKGDCEISYFPYSEAYSLNRSNRKSGEFTAIAEIHYDNGNVGGQCKSVTFDGLKPIVSNYINGEEYTAQHMMYHMTDASCCTSGSRLWFASHWWTNSLSYMQEACPDNPLQRFYYKTDTEQLFLNVNGKWKNILGDDVLLRSPNGTVFTLTVDNDGKLITK